MFEPVLNQTPGSTVVSPVYVMTEAHTLSVASGDATLLVNGVNQGSSASVVTGDQVQFTTAAPTSYDETQFIIINEDTNSILSFVTTEHLESQYYFQFKFVDCLTIQPGIYTTPAIQIYRLVTPMQVSIPDIYGATIIVNGTAQGTACSVTNDDLVSIQLTMPSTAGLAISVPVAIGSYVDYLDLHTAYPSQLVEDVVFQPISGATPATLYTSNEVTLTGINLPITASATGATLYVNGTEVSGSTNVVVGDKVKLQIQTSPFGSTPTYGYLALGERQFTYTVVTAQDALTASVQDAYLGTGLYAAYSSVDNSANAIGVIASDLTLTKVSLTPPTNTVFGEHQLFLTSYFEDCLYILDGDTKETQRKIQFASGSHPVAVISVPGNATESPLVHYVALEGSLQLVELQYETYTPYQYISLPSAPHALAADVENAYIYIATDAGVYTYDVLYGSITLVDNHIKAYDACSSGELVYVSYLTENVIRIFQNGSYINSCTVGLNPMGMCIIDGFLYVCNSSDNSISKIDLTTNTVTQTLQTFSYPVTCSEFNGNLAVVHQGYSTIALFDSTTGDYITRIDTQQTPWGFTNNCCALMYGTNSAKVGDTIVDSMSIAPQYNMDINSTTTITLPAVSRRRHITIPEQGTLYINGVNAGHEARISSKDTVTVECPTAPGWGETITLDIVIDSVIVELSTITAFDVIPDYMEFGGAYNVRRWAITNSDTLTVSGMTTGQYASLTYTHPSDNSYVLVNGVASGKTVVVKDGDTLQLVTEVTGCCNETLTYNLVSNGIVYGSYVTGTWELFGAIRDLPNPEVTSLVTLALGTRCLTQQQNGYLQGGVTFQLPQITYSTTSTIAPSQSSYLHALLPKVQQLKDSTEQAPVGAFSTEVARVHGLPSGIEYSRPDSYPGYTISGLTGHYQELASPGPTGIYTQEMSSSVSGEAPVIQSFTQLTKVLGQPLLNRLVIRKEPALSGSLTSCTTKFMKGFNGVKLQIVTNSTNLGTSRRSQNNIMIAGGAQYRATFQAIYQSTKTTMQSGANHWHAADNLPFNRSSVGLSSLGTWATFEKITARNEMSKATQMVGHHAPHLRPFLMGVTNTPCSTPGYAENKATHYSSRIGKTYAPHGVHFTYEEQFMDSFGAFSLSLATTHSDSASGIKVKNSLVRGMKPRAERYPLHLYTTKTCRGTVLSAMGKISPLAQASHSFTHQEEIQMMWEPNWSFGSSEVTPEGYTSTNEHWSTVAMQMMRNEWSKEVAVTPTYTVFTETVQEDPAVAEGLFATYQEAYDAGSLINDTTLQVYQYGTLWTYRADPDSSIVCNNPPVYPLYVLGGYVSGG